MSFIAAAYFRGTSSASSTIQLLTCYALHKTIKITVFPQNKPSLQLLVSVRPCGSRSQEETCAIPCQQTPCCASSEAAFNALSHTNSHAVCHTHNRMRQRDCFMSEAMD